MKQRTLPIALVVAFVGGAIPILPNAAADTILPGENEPMPIRSTIAPDQFATNQRLAREMMGHIDMAQLALELGIENEASEQIKKAIALEGRLSGQMSRLTLSSTFEYTKASFDGELITAEGRIPVVDNVFLVRDDDATSAEKGVANNLDLPRGTVKQVNMSLTSQELFAALTQAAKSLTDHNTVGASAALHDLFQRASNYNEETDDLELVIMENLALARSLVEHDRYDSARLTLKYVEDQVGRGKQTRFSSIDEESSKRIVSEMDAIRRDLRVKDPTPFDRIGSWLSMLIKNIEDWFS